MFLWSNEEQFGAFHNFQRLLLANKSDLCKQCLFAVLTLRRNTSLWHAEYQFEFMSMRLITLRNSIQSLWTAKIEAVNCMKKKNCATANNKKPHDA